jgi:ribonuclease R
MVKAELEKKIVSLFKKYPGANLTIKEIATILRIRKHDFRNVKDTTNKLAKQGFLKRDKKLFSLDKSKKAGKRRREANPELLVEGTFDATSLAKGYSFAFVITDDGDYFISNEDTNGAYHGDKVLVEPYKNRKDKKYGVVRKITQRVNEDMVGNVTQVNHEYLFLCDNHKIHTSIRVKSPQEDINNKKVRIIIDNWGNHHAGKLPTGKLVSIIGEAHDPDIEVLGVIEQYDLALNFPEEVITEVNDIDMTISESEIAKRADYRNLLTITIDPKTAKDFDDAISLVKEDDGFTLYVHIADVGHYVKPRMKVFTEAVKRGNSFYFPKRVIPMLPEQISNGLCSLRPEEEKLTLTVVTKFDNNLEIVDQFATESVILSDARLNYEEVDELFDNNIFMYNDEIKEMLYYAKDLSRKLSDNLYKSGYINFRLPDIEYLYDDDGHLANIVESEETASHKLIENFMLLANEYVATFLKEQAPATIYRIHEFPDKEKIQQIAKLLRNYDYHITFDGTLNHVLQRVLKSFEDKPEEKVFNKMILRAMKKAQYSTKNLSHFGLSIQNYTHFTSPIRRLSDLIIHLQIKNIIANSGYNFKNVKLKELAQIATDREILSDQAYRTIMKKMIMYFMKDRVGNEYKAVITGMNKSNMFASLENYPITGVIRMSNIPGDYYILDEQKMITFGRKSKKQFKLAQVINIQISAVTDDIYFDIIEE